MRKTKARMLTVSDHKMAAKDDAISGMQKQELEESTTCCICTDTYKYPKLLPCGHTFCMDCIQKTGLKTSKVRMPCPICRRNFNIPSDGFTGLKHNSYVEEQRQLKQMIKIKERLLEEDKKENEKTKAKVKARNTDAEILRDFIEEEIKQNPDDQFSDEEQLSNKTLQLKIENRTKQQKSVKTKAAPLQVDEEHFASGGNSDCIKSKEQPQKDQSEVPNYFSVQNRMPKNVKFSSNKKMGSEPNLKSVAAHSKPDLMDRKFVVSQMHIKEKKTGKKPKDTMTKFKTKPDVHYSGTSSVFRILRESNNSLVLYASNLMTVAVNDEHVATIRDVNVVVSCINHQLDIDGPLADQIIKAAGPDVIAELNRHKNRLLFLQTGDLVHTSAGNMKGLKAIIHVVALMIPQDILLNEKRFRDVLTSVFTNCLHYANDKLKLKSICLPPIGIGAYDTQMVADCFLEAVEMFTSTFEVPSATKQHQPVQNINYIQLAVGRSFSIEQLIECVRKRVGN